MNRLLFLFISLIFVFFSCTKENIITDSGAKLNFSTDTIHFDTIFSTIGSTTKELMVYNPHKETIVIESINLASTSSYFKLNINGVSANKLTDIELSGNDSLYIFIEVTIDPTMQNAPLEIIESIVFKTNGNIQDIKLQAFGQDMTLINGEILETQTWTADKPYFIINSMLVDTLHTLTIEAGTKIHFSKNSSLYVKGKLNVQGEFENPVIFQAARLEKMYSDVPGQWRGIVLLDGSVDNKINYAIIKNASIGINMGNIQNITRPTLEISNSRIEHHSFSGFFVTDAKILATNCIISNCGTYLAALINGGEYEFYHCTLANYWNLSIRKEPSLVITNFLDYDNTLYENDLIKADFKNSIIYGDNENELGFGKIETAQFNYFFKNSLLKAEQEDLTEDLSNANFFEAVEFATNSDKIFVNPYEPDYNFNLDTLETIAKDKGNLNLIDLYPTLLEFDMNKINRTEDFKPDLGAFEQKKQ